nr:MAG TPA: hypothetical protein [Caudoviricetes sp.]
MILEVYLISCSNVSKREWVKNSPKVISKPSHIFLIVDSVMFLRVESKIL